MHSRVVKVVVGAVGAALLLTGATKCGQAVEGNGTGAPPPGHVHHHGGKECHARIVSFAPGAGSIIAQAIAECRAVPSAHLMQVAIFWAPDMTQLEEDPHDVGFGETTQTPVPGREVSLSVSTNNFCGLGFYYVLMNVTGNGGPGFSNFDITYNGRTSGHILTIRKKADCF